MNSDFKQQLKAAYDKDAHRRDSAEGKREQWKLDVREQFVKFLKKSKKKTILELGSGAGIDAKYFQDKGFFVLATDLSDEMVKMCKKRGLDAKVNDLYNLRSLGSRFDAIFSLNVLLHVPRTDLEQVLKGIHDSLNENGVFYYGVYGGRDEEKIITKKSQMGLPRLFSFLSDETIQKVIGDLFEIIEFKTIDVGSDKPYFHFQSLLLRRNNMYA